MSNSIYRKNSWRDQGNKNERRLNDTLSFMRKKSLKKDDEINGLKEQVENLSNLLKTAYEINPTVPFKDSEFPQKFELIKTGQYFS